MKKFLLLFTPFYLSAMKPELTTLVKQLIAKKAPVPEQSIARILTDQMIQTDQKKQFQEAVHCELRKILDQKNAQQLININRTTDRIKKFAPLCTAVLFSLQKDAACEHYAQLLHELGAKPCNLLLAHLLTKRAVKLGKMKDVSLHEKYLNLFLDPGRATRVLQLFYQRNYTLHSASLRFLLQKGANPNIDLVLKSKCCMVKPLDIENNPVNIALLKDYGGQDRYENLCECEPYLPFLRLNFLIWSFGCN